MSYSGQELLATLERRFAENKAANLKGTAYVRISQLSFPNPHRPIDQKIVDSLTRDFGKEGCLVHQRDFAIPAYDQDDRFSAYLEGACLNPEKFKTDSATDPPRVEFPTAGLLECLHGQHRVLAAAEYLPPGDRWWMVDIYGKGLDRHAIERLREGYSYSTNYTTGEIYRQIRLSQHSVDVIRESRWRARLKDLTEQYLEKLLKRPLLVQALDSVLPMHGLWKYFQLGSMDIVFSLGCYEEFANYVTLIKEVFTFIFGYENLQYLDGGTVEAVRLRAPAISKSDAQFIQKEMRLKRLVPSITDVSTRDAIEQRLLGLEGRIPDFFSLFKDIRYLEAPARAMRALLPEHFQGSLRQNFRFISNPRGSNTSLEVQTSETTFKSISGSPECLFDWGYRQTFVAALRYFASPVNITTRKDMNPIRQTVNASKRLLGFKLIEVARHSGFAVSPVNDMLSEDPVRRLLYDLLHTLPQELYKFETDIPPQLLASFKDYLHASSVPGALGIPAATVQTGEPLARRCGRSCGGQLVDDDRQHMFLDKLHAPFASLRNLGDGVSSFFVKRAIYLAFFGKIDPGAIPSPSAFHQRSEATLENASEQAIPVPAGGVAPEPLSERAPSRNLASEDRGHVPPLRTNFNGQAIKFLSTDGTVLHYVSFNKDAVTAQAKQFADAKKSLATEDGNYIFWRACYDQLVELGATTVVVLDRNARKRRRTPWDTGEP